MPVRPAHALTRRRFAATLAAPFVLQTGFSTGVQAATANATTTAALRLRSGPGANYATLATIPNNTTVSIYAGPSNGWWRVTYGTRIGWCSGSYLNVGNASPVDSATTISALRLRTGPGTNFAALITIPSGGTVDVLAGPSNGWYQLRYDSRIGWSSGEFLSFEEDEEETGSAYVDTDVLNLRNGPSTGNSVVTRMLFGETVETLDQSGAWYKVDYHGRTGWCSGDYLTFGADSASFWVPTHQQKYTLSCEYASLQIATEALGNKVPEDDFIPVVGFDANPHEGFRGDIDGAYLSYDDYGVYPEPLVDALPEFGFKGVAFYGGTQRLKDHLSAGHPTLVFVDMKPVSSVQMTIEGQQVTMSKWSHVIVAYGYSPDGVLVSDPDSATRKRLYRWSTFNSMWNSMDGMALAVMLP